MPNFTGVLGWRVPSLVHTPANTMPNRMMNTGLMDWTADGLNSMPRRLRSRRVSA